MTRGLLLLSTCGISVLTNGAPADVSRWLNSIANVSDSDLDVDAKNQLDEFVVLQEARLRATDAFGRRRLSAELNGIAAVLERWPAPFVQHLLVHSDTAVGRAAAKIVRTALLEEGRSVEFLTAGGLRTDDLASFRYAIAELTKGIENWVSGWNVIFNLTGGFKSINAYLQALGMLYAERCVFLFEGAPTLIEIPKLPVQLAEANEVRQNLATFRKLALGYSVTIDEVGGVPDALLLFDDGHVTTSVWGDVVWNRVKDKLFGNDLFEPLSSRVVLKQPVHKEFEDLPSDRRVQINEAIDALSAYLDIERPLLQSNQLKKLVGNPSPPSTHELYLWSDGAAWRLFGHFDEDQRFVADQIGRHL